MNNETMSIVDEEEDQISESPNEKLLLIDLGEVSNDTKGGYGFHYHDGGIGYLWLS